MKVWVTSKEPCIIFSNLNNQNLNILSYIKGDNKISNKITKFQIAIPK